MCVCVCVCGLCVCMCVCGCVCVLVCYVHGYTTLDVLKGGPINSPGLDMRKLTESSHAVEKNRMSYIDSDTFNPLSIIVSNLAIQNFSRFLGFTESVRSIKVISTSFSIEV